MTTVERRRADQPVVWEDEQDAQEASDTHASLKLLATPKQPNNAWLSLDDTELAILYALMGQHLELAEFL
ncbi:MAG: hypothetical protein H7Z17_05215 [Fuerstia sp.]|nr:hypothetical protein [Fuerstiella sp.]